MADIRCKLCGRAPEGDPEFTIRYFQHREAEKARRITTPFVYVCPICSGRVRYQADKEMKEKT